MNNRRSIPQRRNLHYHIVCKCRNFNYPEIITPYERTAVSEFTKLVTLLHDVLHISLVSWLVKRAMFMDGTIVEWAECHEDCRTNEGRERARGKNIEYNERLIYSIWRTE